MEKSEIIIIRKPGDRNPFSQKSYRPIMLLPLMGKLLERLLAVRVSPRIEQSGLFSDKQFGFPRSMSTEDAVVHLINTQNQKSKFVVGILPEHMITYRGLVSSQVYQSIISSKTLNVFRSYFSERSAVIRHNMVPYQKK